MEKIFHTADALIIGGGAAGLFAAIRLSEINPRAKIIIVDKADIRRSGCLAAGVNALNAYIGEGHTPEDYVEYALNDAHGIARRDLLLSMSRRLNGVTEKIERLGLTILKDAAGKYVTRGWRNVKINGENLKPILAGAVKNLPNVEIFNHVNAVDFVCDGGKVLGAYGFSTREKICHGFSAKATLIATGGAAGIYQPNHAGGSRHQIWYSPFNTGAGYAMGIRAGAEMTTFEMRFIALRCKDTIAPTGTLAQGVGAAQINSRGELYQKKYGNTTSERVYAVTAENLAGRGPCYLQTAGISDAQEKDLLDAYLNMAPAQTLRWLETGQLPKDFNVKIAGTEPYIVGGHTAAGYWVDANRRTTLKNLYAAGDVAGGCPQKYVTGAFAEAEIAAENIAEVIAGESPARFDFDTAELEKFFANESAFSVDDLEVAMQAAMDEYSGDLTKKNITGAFAEAEIAAENIAEVIAGESPARFDFDTAELEKFFANESVFSVDDLEAAMQAAMDEYAGGLTQNYRFSERQLDLAAANLERIENLSAQLHAAEMYDLLKICELRERLTVAKVLVEHLRARRETRWAGFVENLDYPARDEKFNCFVNSVTRGGRTEIIFRQLDAQRAKD